MGKEPEVKKSEAVSQKEAKAERLKLEAAFKSKGQDQSELEKPLAANRNAPTEENNSAIDIPHSDLETLTTDHSPLTTEMEVHHHPQLEHKPKPWKEYLLEGLMIFVAVTMGFFAESLREHITDNEREAQYVHSIVEDLKDDRSKLEIHIKNIHKSKLLLDSLITILNDPAAIPAHGADIYYFGRLGPRLSTITVNMRTYDQLKNSGNFRLISKINISNGIMAYYKRIPYIRQVEDLYSEEFANYKRYAANVFEPAVFNRQENDKGDIIRATDNPALQKNASASIKQLALYAVYMNGSGKQILTNDEDLLKSANDLLDHLQKEYNLKDE